MGVFMNENDKLLIAKANDLFRLCQRRSEPVFSAFLDGGEQAVIEDSVTFPYGCNVRFFGGYEGAERKILGVFPEWSEPDGFPIKALTVKSNFTKKLTHRDYLGTLMAQGLDRAKFGDIIVDEGNAYIFVCEDIAYYLADNIRKIGNTGVSSEVSELSDIVIPKPKRERLSAVCASLRLDAVVGAVCNISRGDSQRLIKSGFVKVNHRISEDSSRTVKEQDLLSVRGYGRFLFISADAQTRKGRLHITAERYV